MLYKFNRGRLTVVARDLDTRIAINVEKFGAKINVFAYKRYVNSKNLEFEIYSDKKLTLPQFIELNILVRESYKQYKKEGEK